MGYTEEMDGLYSKTHENGSLGGSPISGNLHLNDVV